MKRSLALLLVLAASACGGGGDDASDAVTIAVFRSLGSAQCTGGGTTADALRNLLINAGVQVVAMSCGSDGIPQPAVCGASDGAIAVFDVSVSQQSVVQSLGFSLLTSLPGAVKRPC